MEVSLRSGSATLNFRWPHNCEQIALIMIKLPKCEYRIPGFGSEVGVNRSCNASAYVGAGGAVAEVCRTYQDSGSGARHSASEQGSDRQGSELEREGGMSNVMQS